MHKMEKRDESRRLFVDEGLTYPEIVRAMRIPLSTVKSWGMKGKWKQARQAYQHSGETLDASIDKAKLLIIDKLVNVFNGAAPFESEVVYATVKAGMFLLLLQADCGRGNSQAVLNLLEALNKTDDRIGRVPKSTHRSRGGDGHRGGNRTRP